MVENGDALHKLNYKNNLRYNSAPSRDRSRGRLSKNPQPLFASATQVLFSSCQKILVPLSRSVKMTTPSRQCSQGGLAIPRIPRRHLWSDAACYHILNRGHNRTAIFADDEDRTVFLGLLARYRQRYAFRLFHYCLMSNHFHLLLQLQSPRQLSTIVAGLLRAYVHHCHRRHQFVGHLWQGRFKSPVIQKDDYWLSCGRYIERNPVEAGLVVEPWQYPWSSACAMPGEQPMRWWRKILVTKNWRLRRRNDSGFGVRFW